MRPGAGDAIDGAFFQRLEDEFTLEQFAEPRAVEERVRDAALVAVDRRERMRVDSRPLRETRVARGSERCEEEAVALEG